MSTIAEFALSQGIPVVKRHGEDCIQVSDETFEYLSHHGEPIEVPLSCSCAQRTYPHELSVHKAITFESRTNRWPWSLRFAPRMEACFEHEENKSARGRVRL